MDVGAIGEQLSMHQHQINDSIPPEQEAASGTLILRKGSSAFEERWKNRTDRF